MKKELLTILFLLLTSIGFSQETTKIFYLNIPGRPLGDPYSIYSESRSCNYFVEIGLLSKVDTTYLCKVNHDWIINDNGDWKLLDITWAKSHGNPNKPNLFWYQTPPKDFIKTHLPENERWSFTRTTISLEEFDIR